ncbi:glycosyltransferase domain-containing protein [Alkalibacterium olivapovliticus]|uniref:Uncharacterized protein DUF616 n=1 Tax=Alkalibacterium olivapovliticus TaxID=99907 RepID=A0A2T0W7K5_9LACT|nr:glycosyltransferase domain-containing protein [Alkalibacterium olivapovliticus]PRY82675.1 uncharacterized protein DUF616 [Alkalibacterium olivapovliticus]
MFANKNVDIEKINNDFLKVKLVNKKDFWKKNIKRKAIYSFYRFGILKKHVKRFNKYDIKEIDTSSNYFSEDRIVIYTVIFGNYDNIVEPDYVPDNCDYFIITDNNISQNSKWKKFNVELDTYSLIDKSNIEKNRYFKMKPHELFSDYKYSIYVDGNIKISTDFTEFIHNMNSYGLKLHNHYRQSCVYKEINNCIKIKKDNEANLLRHMNHLKASGMPQNYGMLEAPVIVREHNNPDCVRIMEEWWKEFSKYSKRDQISLPFILWKNKIKISEVAILGKDIYSNYAFRKVKHR